MICCQLCNEKENVILVAKVQFHIYINIVMRKTFNQAKWKLAIINSKVQMLVRC